MGQTMSNPEFFSRKIDYNYFKRAEKIPSADAPHYLDSIVVSLHRAIDDWRYNDGDVGDVSMCVDALSALWSTIEDRSSI